MSQTFSAASVEESGETKSLASRLVDVPRLADPGRLRCLLVAGALIAAAAAYCVGDPTAYLTADPKLGLLLRGMAVIKAMISLAAVAALWWRFGRPIPRLTAAVYLTATWMTAGASMLVWQLWHIGIGALAFHAGELTLLMFAWREHRAE
jgi:hypothetical protein